MKDAKGKDIEVGTEVAFTVGTALVFGSVAEVKNSTSYGRTFEVAKIALDKPEIIYHSTKYLPPTDPTIRAYSTEWYRARVQVPPKNLTSARLFRKVSDSSRIVVIG